MLDLTVATCEKCVVANKVELHHYLLSFQEAADFIVHWMSIYNKKDRCFFCGFRKFYKFSTIYQPPESKSSSNSCFFFIFGKISIGGMYNPDADIQTFALFSPRSEELLLFIW